MNPKQRGQMIMQDDIYTNPEESNCRAEICPRGGFHPLIATEEQPVGGSGLGHLFSITFLNGDDNYNVNLHYTHTWPYYI